MHNSKKAAVCFCACLQGSHWWFACHPPPRWVMWEVTWESQKQARCRDYLVLVSLMYKYKQKEVLLEWCWRAGWLWTVCPVHSKYVLAVLLRMHFVWTSCHILYIIQTWLSRSLFLQAMGCRLCHLPGALLNVNLMKSSHMLDTSLCAKKKKITPESKQIPVNSSKYKLICHLQPQYNYSIKFRQNENNTEVSTTGESWALAKSPSCACLLCVCSSIRLIIVKRPSERQTCGVFFQNPATVWQNVILQGASSLWNCHLSWDFWRKTFWSYFEEQISNYSVSSGLQ